jgi:putative membrane protein
MNDPNSRPDQNRSDTQRIDDRKFLEDAALGGLTEIAVGKLAVEKGASDAVKQFGQKMIDDHIKSNDELKRFAASGGVTVPDTLDSRHQSRVDKLAKLSGAEFDKAYIKDQQKYHQQNAKEFKQEAENGSVAQVKDFAAKAVPAVQQHLELAKELNKK